MEEIKQEWFDINKPPSHDASQSEDCLLLDVMVPTTIFDKAVKDEPCDDDPGAPVLVWIDGGGFTGGYKHETNPAGLIENSIVLGEEFVYVSINYRLGLYVSIIMTILNLSILILSGFPRWATPENGWECKCRSA